ncbi:MAG: type V CRISPR-associated protein Cas12a/Cpf1, partial [Treponema sp.]|nr:type V CRISPR-associated protein Cas12a/Cpf1 [Treponema sp.]
EKDSAFYERFEKIMEELSKVVPLYNKVRNYVTKKATSEEKFKLNFDCPTLADGWDENKENQNNAILLKKDGQYFLGIFNPKDKPKFDANFETDEKDCYEKMIYKLLPGPNKMLPKVFFSQKGLGTFNPPKEILDGYEKGKFKKGDAFDLEFCHKLINWFKDAINRHEDWKKFNFTFSDTKSYEDISAFYREITEQGYKITFSKIPSEFIDKSVDEGKLLLFQIYNKDFAQKATGKKNLHTMYWENLFSEENLKDTVLKLNGEAELFFRPASIKQEETPKHEKGSVLVNRTTKEGVSIPEDIYQELYKKANSKLTGELSEEAKQFEATHTIVTKTATHEIVKDKHYTKNTYLFHCPITMNFKAAEITGKKFNDKVLEYLKDNPEVKIIGIDRGERHLLYLSLINQKGEIEIQKTLNIVDQMRGEKNVKIDYQQKLHNKETERDKARKNWQTIGNIKELKEGYLSVVVHDIAKMMIENNAILVMEDLNFGFKRGRFAVERQVYQKFEQMLIDKLNYLVFKDKKPTEPGGVLNAYQLTDKFESFAKLGKQCGWIFYVPAAYTSKIDPKTGFANLLDMKNLTNVAKKREFFEKFDSICFDEKEKMFAFTFDYKNFGGKGAAEMKQTKWTVYANGDRLVYNSKTKSTEKIDLTESLVNLFNKNGINYDSGNNLLDSILEIGADLKQGEKPSKEIANFWDSLLYYFKITLQMRNSIPNTEEDYLISPVKAPDGKFFDSREQQKFEKDAKLPIDADANGAYHIALKGLYLLKN